MSLDRFEVVEELGAGAFGTVYKARDTQLDRLVALKIPRFGALGSEGAAHRFLREARAAGNLRHPNIVPIYDAGKVGESYFIASGFIEGQTLADLMDGDEKLSQTQAAMLIRKLAEALHYAHTKGIIHRDVKPANVMMDGDGEPLVMDFGMARRDEGEVLRTQEGARIGTPAYMSPEQHAGQSHLADARSDQWALGVMLYELLTGQRPFQAPNVLQVAYQVRETEPDRPRKLDSTISKDLETICLKCLEKEPEKRYASCQHLAEELARTLRGEPIAARPIGRGERFGRWCKRNPVVAGLIATVAFFLVLGTIGTSVMAVRANAEAYQADLARNRAEEQQRFAESEKSRADEKTIKEQKARREVEAALEHTERLLYCIRMQAAGRAWCSADIEQVQAHLSACPARLHGWEYGYLKRLLDRPITLRGHSALVSSVAYSPDGERIVSGGYWDHSVKVWDASAGKVLMMLRGHSNDVPCVAYSPNGKQIATASSDKTVKVWDAASGKELITLPVGTYLGGASVAFSPSGTQILTPLSDKTLAIWDVEIGEETMTLMGGRPPVAFSPDGRWVAAQSDDHTVKLWDPTSGKETMILRGHSKRLTSLAFSSDGKRVVSGSEDTTIRVWDAASGQETMCLRGHSKHVTSAVFSPDGKRIVSASRDHTVRVWDATSGEEEACLRGHSAPVRSVAFSPDGKRIVSGSDDMTLKIWEASMGKEAMTLTGVSTAAFSGDGSWIYCGPSSPENAFKVWETASGKHLRTLRVRGLPNHVADWAFSADGKRIVSASLFEQILRVWDADSGNELRTLVGHSGHVYCTAISPDGRFAVSGSFDKTVKVWDTATGEDLITLRGHAKPVHRVAFSPDAKRILSTSADATMRIWDTANGEETMTFRTGTLCWGAAFSPDGSLLSAASNNAIRLWDATSGEEVACLRGHSDTVLSIAFSPDGKRIVSGSSDTTVKLWDLETSEETITLRGHSDDVWHVAFSPDGMRILSYSSDRTAKIWEAASWQADEREASEETVH